jgi:ribosomal protein S18 acetylase RimI-like enzyme
MNHFAGTEELPARPQPDGSDIRKVTESDLPRLVDALARAFYDDPMMSWVFSDDSRRRQRLLRGFDFYLRKIWLPHDECYATDQLSGGALWMPPDTWHLSISRQLRLLPGMVRVAGRELPRLMRVLNAMEAKHPHDRHYYLPVIGVAPEGQGKGFGSALLRPILDRCDKEGSPAYLEASSRRSRALYERHGFELVEEFHPVEGSPPLWRMWREPQPAPAH